MLRQASSGTSDKATPSVPAIGNFFLHNAKVNGRKPTEGIVHRTRFTKGSRLFNLKNDIGQSRDLSKQHPEVVERLKKLYAVWSNDVAGKARGNN